VTQPLIAVVGPTASGKSDLAVRICQAIGGEVVSADSVQIYRHFDIGSAKPTSKERAGIPHHLIDELAPLDAADAARFAELAADRIADITRRGRRPVLCGGTFLWLRALIYGLAPAPPADEAIRARHRSEAELLGRPHLHERLKAVDPESHARLSPNDLLRVSRALEVHELTGQTLSQLQALHGFRTPRYDVRFIAVAHEREALYQRIHERTLQMFEQGWLDEVRQLLDRGYAEARALRSVGYRQLLEAVQSGAPLDQPALIASVTQATRVFVRRQTTWLRDQPVSWLQPGEVRDFSLDTALAAS
jgi:tRNA dimethylallyltransferase